MAVQLDYSPDFSDENLRAFLADPTNPQNEFSSDKTAALPDSSREMLREVLPPMLVGRISEDDTPVLCTSQVYRVDVIDRASGATLNYYEIKVPYKHSVTVDICAALFIHDDAAPDHRTRIETAFRTFQPGRSNPYRFIVDLDEAGVPDTHYEVVCFMKVTKVRSQEVSPNLAEQLQANPYLRANEDLQYHDERLTASRLEVKVTPKGWSADEPDVDVPKSPLTSPQLVQECDPPLSEDWVERTIDEVASQLTGGREECAAVMLETRNKRLMTILKYPEFRVEIVSAIIKIGCVKVRIWYPQLQYSQTTLALFAFSRLDYHKAGDALGDSLEDCVIFAFITGGIAGTATGNFAVAVAAFELFFKECVKARLASLLKCLVAGLFIAKEKGDWHKV